VAGFNSKKAFKKANPDYFIQRLEELIHIFLDFQSAI